MATLPLPLDFYNRPPKELAGYSSTVVDDGGETGAPTGPPGPPDVPMPFHAVYGYPVSLPNQPATEITPAAFMPRWFDARGFTHARLVANLQTAAASGAVVQLQYAPDYPTAPTSFSDAGSPGSLVLRIDQTGALKSAWVPLNPDPTTGARRDVVWKPAFAGGDGATTPIIGHLEAQFRVAGDTLLEKWFLRTGAPTDPDGVGASLDPADTPLVHTAVRANAFFSVESSYGTPFTTFDLPDASGLGVLSLTKGNSPAAAGGELLGTADPGTYVCSWVGPSLAGGQTIPQSSVMMFYKEEDSLFHSFPVWEVGIWRPTVGIVATWRFGYVDGYVARRFVPLNKYEYAVSMDGSGLAATVDGDRWIVGLGMTVENTGSQCFGHVAYNGTYEPVPGQNVATDGASYLLLPKMRYLSLIA